ncbi:glycerophosphodiester phosphodiesterase family protein [Bacillus sp. 1P06AnD]|uniref:glycerophosphodiester phosphodiesterase family protein n=1 Tax=Bacillus sp. 1P06AnD TaxID=3132208 RepID=UPI0039A342E2
MNRHIASVKQLLFWNWKNLLLFAILYALFGLLFLYPLLRSILLATIQEAHLQYLTAQNLYTWISAPTTIPLCLLTAILLGNYIMIEFAVLITHFDFVRRGEKIGFFNMVGSGIKEASRIFWPANWLFVPLALVLFPLTSFPLLTDLTVNLRIPEFIIDFLREKPLLYLFYLMVLLAIHLIVFYLFFSLCFFTLEKLNFTHSCKRSIQLIQGRLFKIFLSYVWWMVQVLFLVLLVITALLLLFVIRVKMFESDPVTAFLDDFMVWKQISFLLFSIFTLVGTFSFMCYTYFQLTNKWKITERKNKKIKWASFTFSAIQVLVIIFLTGMYLDYRNGAYFFYDRPQLHITAHRAGAALAPENTLAALNQAIEAKATMAEIDVQQTKDGKLIVMHDSDFKRVAKVPKKVWTVSAEEAQTFEVGSSFSKKFKGEKIPLLEEMIKEADGRIKLMIELKMNGHDKQLVKRVLQVIQKNNFTDQCIVASMDARLLQQVKTMDPTIKTAYITAVAYGNLHLMKNVDVFSIEASFVNSDLVASLQSTGKEVFVWTVNEKDAINRTITMPVNGLITDNPYLAAFYYQLNILHPFAKDIIQLFL